MSFQDKIYSYKPHRHRPFAQSERKTLRAGAVETKQRIIALGHRFGIHRFKLTDHAIWQIHTHICDKTGFSRINGEFNELRSSGAMNSYFWHWLQRFEAWLEITNAK